LHWTRVWVVILFALAVAPVRAQVSSVSEKFLINAKSASTWSKRDVNFIQLQGPVAVEMDNLKLSADNAVIRLTPLPGGLLGEQDAQIVLIGNAQLQASENHLTRSGPELLVSVEVRGTPQLAAEERASRDMSDSSLFMQAQEILNAGGPPAQAAAPASVTPVIQPAPGPPPANPEPAALPGASVAPAPQPRVTTGGPVQFHEGSAVTPGTFHQGVAADGTAVFELSGDVVVTQTRDNGDYLELLADRVVLFTNMRGEASRSAMDTNEMSRRITAAYLEGDVRINVTPATGKRAEQRLTADRAYYDFPTDRAVLTDVVMRSVDPQTQLPIIMRAQTVRQLSLNEFNAEHSTLTTSNFVIPGIAIRSSYIYVRQEQTSPTETDYDFVGRSDVMIFMGAPVFYLPYVAGTMNNDPFPLREISMGNNSRLGGFGVQTDWGLFESLGLNRPKDLDLSYHLDYFATRGEGAGLDGTYKGGFVTDDGDPWNFQGDFKSYLMTDRGTDLLGGDRLPITPPTELRGLLLWQHQHFFPDDWQVQVRAGWESDPTFLEEYYQQDFDNDMPLNAEFYVKHQKDTEALAFDAETDTTTFITNDDRQQEQFDVARLPELEYYRIGDSVADDDMTFFSDNSASRLVADSSHYSLAQQGYGYQGLTPGLPSDGFTGTTAAPIYRGDTRQELDWPMTLGQFKVVPYGFERLTGYSNSPGGDPQVRLFSGAGARMTTTFWDVDDSVSSDLFDLHRVRHVIQPEINLFTSAATDDNSRLFIYDPNVDAINPITGAQLALHQHWDTMRGGPGRYQSVDFLDINVEANLYAHQPPANLIDPTNFRGLFFPGEPEASVPRQGINGDATWRISDTTSFISDVEWNLDQHELAIAQAGIAVQRGDRLSYYIGDDYVQDLDSQILSLVLNYQLTDKYSFSFGQNFNFGDARDVSSSLSILRRFDTMAVQVAVWHDAINHVNGFNLNVIPNGFPAAGALGGAVSNLVTPQP
jgi:lipopolysaccharide export system protein LptA